MTTFDFLLTLLNILLKSIVESLIEKVMEDIFTCSHYFFFDQAVCNQYTEIYGSGHGWIYMFVNDD